MSQNIMKFTEFLSSFSWWFMIAILIALVIMVGAIIYIMYIEKRNMSWLNQRKATVQAVYSMKKIPFIYNIQTKIANKIAITNTATRQENEKYALYVLICYSFSYGNWYCYSLDDFYYIL